MNRKLRRILPHAAILLCNMYIVFFLIDRVNTAMQFINNSITKALLLILCVISTINASFLIQDERNREAARSRRQGAPGNRVAPGARAAQGARTARSASGAQAVRSPAPGSAAPRSASAQRQAPRSASGRGGAR